MVISEMRREPTIQLSTIPTAVAGQHRHTCHPEASRASRSSLGAGDPDNRPSGRVAHLRQSRRRSCQANRGRSLSRRQADRRTLRATMYAPTPKQVTRGIRSLIIRHTPAPQCRCTEASRGVAGRIIRLPRISAPSVGTSSLPAAAPVSLPVFVRPSAFGLA